MSLLETHGREMIESDGLHFPAATFPMMINYARKELGVITKIDMLVDGQWVTLPDDAQPVWIDKYTFRARFFKFDWIAARRGKPEDECLTPTKIIW